MVPSFKTLCLIPYLAYRVFFREALFAHERQDTPGKDDLFQVPIDKNNCNAAIPVIFCVFTVGASKITNILVG